MPIPSATLATKTVAIFNEIPVIPITPNRIIIAAIIGMEAYKPFKAERRIRPTMMMTKIMAIDILPN